MLNSAPYTFLDEAPLEERRARAVQVRRALPAEDAAAFGALDAQAIAQVIEDASLPMRDADEVHDALLQLGVVGIPATSGQWEPTSGLWERSPDRDVRALISQGRATLLTHEGHTLAVAAERIPLADALFPAAQRSPPLSPLPGDGPISREDAVHQVVRGHLEICGPTTARELAERTCLPADEVNLALFNIEAQGQVLRGSFRPGASADELEWCDRRLLQRIHRLTVGKLRKEIAPLSAQDFMRFLFRWHHLEDQDRLRGTNGMLKAISLLQGYEAPAAAWELALLPARMRPYLPDLLEKVCFHGEVAFARLSMREAPKPDPGPRRGAVVVAVPDEAASTEPAPARRRVTPSRSANLTFIRRADLDWLIAASRPVSEEGVVLPEDLSHPAREVANVLKRRGASFFHELVAATRRLAAEVEDGLWELLGRGLITADALENLRVLQSPKRRKRQRAMGRGGPGRWSLLSPLELTPKEKVITELARLYLQRYGIVFRELVVREPLAPSWRELAWAYRRMEARGEIRGGRFLAGQIGEQFALPEAVDMARAVRRAPLNGQRVHLAAVDPLNLTGIVTPGPRVAAQLGSYVTYVDGLPQVERNVEQPPAVRSALAH
jgi:ATP-dependent Lhr-like helicase